MTHQSRRDFLGVLGAGAAALFGCQAVTAANTFGGGSARLTARPKTPSTFLSPGTWPITEANPADGVLVIPSKYSGKPMPLVLGLHGAGGAAQGQVNLLGSYAESRGFLLLAVGARGVTWDVFNSKFSYDVTFIDSALKWAFDRCAVDPSRIVVEGFSDGASYTLALALANGDFFTRAVAFSPGFIPSSDSPAVGKPKFFESHGTQDTVLPIAGASRRIVPGLKDKGYSVDYFEFDGGHTVPADVAAKAADWIVA